MAMSYLVVAAGVYVQPDLIARNYVWISQVAADQVVSRVIQEYAAPGIGKRPQAVDRRADSISHHLAVARVAVEDDSVVNPVDDEVFHDATAVRHPDGVRKVARRDFHPDQRLWAHG